MDEHEEIEASRHHPAYLWRAHQVKEFIESIMDEKDRALQMAGEEREKAAAALRNEQQRALDQAEREREKAAIALRDQLAEQIRAGDRNLQEHITAQVAQLKQMVENAETLSLERHESGRREAMIQHAADQAAIAKAEKKSDDQFAAANEWRGQSADRERTQQEQIASFVATLTPLAKSEAIEDKLAAATERNREDIAVLTNRFNQREGQSAGVKQNQASIYALIAAVGVVLGIIIVVANAWPH